jgi:hypothetical protein
MTACLMCCRPVGVERVSGERAIVLCLRCFTIALELIGAGSHQLGRPRKVVQPLGAP